MASPAVYGCCCCHFRTPIDRLDNVCINRRNIAYTWSGTAVQRTVSCEEHKHQHSSICELPGERYLPASSTQVLAQRFLMYTWVHVFQRAQTEKRRTMGVITSKSISISFLIPYLVLFVRRLCSSCHILRLIYVKYFTF